MVPRVLVSLVAGLIFGLGLTISRMIDPAKVLGFLDVAGKWDPSLAFVMAGAVFVAALGYWLAGSRARPIIEADFHGSTRSSLDRPLVIGAALFGIGWGLVGYCPGPALASLGLGRGETLIFLAAMVAGMGVHRLYELQTAAKLPGELEEV
jgi:uncharacterized membrane protein YedE/YeeE